MATTADAVRTIGSRERILDAAFSAVASYGLTRLTMDDVAQAAGLSRQTVYRYFDSKDDLIIALVYREEEVFLEGVRSAHAASERLEDAMREAVLFCLRTARQHPLLDRLLTSEPQVLLPYLTTRGSGLIARARGVLEELASGRAEVDETLIHRAADLAVRAMLSYTLTPSDDDPEDVARGIARILTSALQTHKEDVR